MRLPYIIGEAGSCHMGKLETAIELVGLAANAGCDAVKFQYWSVPGRMRARRKIEDPQAYESGSIRPSWFPFLRDAAYKRGLEFICTAYLPEDVEEIFRWVDAIKVASFEVHDTQLIDAVAAHNVRHRKVFASFGMTERGEVEVPWYWHRLYCVSAYPCPLDQANLSAIQYFDGYSDHTRNTWTGGLAVAAGAKDLEVHFRGHETPADCPDYVVALPPGNLRDYVVFARHAMQAYGRGEVRPQPCEQANMQHRVGV